MPALSESMHFALLQLANLEEQDERAGWMATPAPTRAALVRRGYVEPCDHHVPIAFPDPIGPAPYRYKTGPERHFYKLTGRGHAYVGTTNDTRKLIQALR